MQSQPDGRLAATPLETHGSGDVASLAMTDGFVELSADIDVFPAGVAVPLFRWDS
jgi:molybdopterin molybdotransferase